MTVWFSSSSSSMLSLLGLTVTDPLPTSPSQENWIPSLVTLTVTAQVQVSSPPHAYKEMV